MQNYFKVITAVLILFTIFALPKQSLAQWHIGASYEIREEVPENGFGVRLERSILGAVPAVDVRLRGHFSYFSEDNYLGRDDIEYGTIESYDFGLAATGGIYVGLLMPYIGVGLGSTTTDLRDAEIPTANDGAESRLFWNGFIGAELSPVPAIKPFVEYRIKSAESFDELRESVGESNGRLIFGISLSF